MISAMQCSRRIGYTTRREGSTPQLYCNFKLLQLLFFRNKYFRLYCHMGRYLRNRLAPLNAPAEQQGKMPVAYHSTFSLNFQTFGRL